jgi:hypothetical protein
VQISALKPIVKYLAICLLLFHSEGPASAQDQCVALIQNGVYNTYRTVSGNSNVSQAQAQFCSDYNSYNRPASQAISRPVTASFPDQLPRRRIK